MMRGLIIQIVFLLVSVQFAWAAGGSSHGNPGMDSAFLFKSINFILIVVALIALLKKPFTEFFANRALVLKQNINKSKEFHEKVLAEASEIKSKLDSLERECTSLKDSVKQTGEEESKKILEQCSQFVEKINQDARRLVQSEIARANEELKDLTVKHIQALATESIKREMTTADEDKLISRFMERLEGNTRH